ncbi:MAG: glutamyl-tRNA reductase [Candidatus Omnitrophica bacterium]|nr:glutamyl-tRNA reductase [Candidatus Omnitrophota bacterium]
MSLSVLGMNHRTAPIHLRERLSIPSRDLPKALPGLLTASIQEAVILSTCNRTELYAVSGNLHEARAQGVELLAGLSHLEPSEFEAHLYWMERREAAHHLFRVTAGLDSMILGETEITAQVKHAYGAAVSAGAADSILNRLFQKAFHCAHLVRSRTDIAKGQTSIGSMVVRWARESLGQDLECRSALVWGAGKASESTARNLTQAGLGRLWVVNRTLSRAQDLAEICRAGWASWEEGMRYLEEVDLAVLSTQAPHYVLSREDMLAVMTRRSGRPVYLLDLAVPRNVDPAAGEVRGVHLKNIDDLTAASQAALKERGRHLPACELILHDQVEHFMEWLNRGPLKEEVTCPVQVS